MLRSGLSHVLLNLRLSSDGLLSNLLTNFAFLDLLLHTDSGNHLMLWTGNLKPVIAS